MTKLERIVLILSTLADNAVTDSEHPDQDEASRALHNETAQAYVTAADIVAGFIDDGFGEVEDEEPAGDKLSDLTEVKLRSGFENAMDVHDIVSLSELILRLRAQGY